MDELRGAALDADPGASSDFIKIGNRLLEGLYEMGWSSIFVIVFEVIPCTQKIFMGKVSPRVVFSVNHT